MHFTRIAKICFRIAAPFLFVRRVCLVFSGRGELSTLRTIVGLLTLRQLRRLFIAILTGNLIVIARIFRSVTTLTVRVRPVSFTTVEVRFFRNGVLAATLRVRAACA